MNSSFLFCYKRGELKWFLFEEPFEAVDELSRIYTCKDRSNEEYLAPEGYDPTAADARYYEDNVPVIARAISARSLNLQNEYVQNVGIIAKDGNLSGERQLIFMTGGEEIEEFEKKHYKNSKTFCYSKNELFEKALYPFERTLKEKLSFLDDIEMVLPERRMQIKDIRDAINYPLDWALRKEAEYQLKEHNLPVDPYYIRLFVKEMEKADVFEEYDQRVFYTQEDFFSKHKR